MGLWEVEAGEFGWPPTTAAPSRFDGPPHQSGSGGWRRAVPLGRQLPRQRSPQRNHGCWATSWSCWKAGPVKRLLSRKHDNSSNIARRTRVEFKLHLDSVQANDVSNLKDFGMVLQLVAENGANNLQVWLICYLQAWTKVWENTQKHISWYKVFDIM